METDPVQKEKYLVTHYFRFLRIGEAVASEMGSDNDDTYSGCCWLDSGSQRNKLHNGGKQGDAFYPGCGDGSFESPQIQGGSGKV